VPLPAPASAEPVVSSYIARFPVSSLLLEEEEAAPAGALPPTESQALAEIEAIFTHIPKAKPRVPGEAGKALPRLSEGPAEPNRRPGEESARTAGAPEIDEGEPAAGPREACACTELTEPPPDEAPVLTIALRPEEGGADSVEVAGDEATVDAVSRALGLTETAREPDE
jgi:hypothetical protein